MKEFRVIAKLRNNRLMTLRQERGLSQAALARAVGVTLNHVGALESWGTNGPWAKKRGGIKLTDCPILMESLGKIAKFFNVDPEWLCPADLFEAVKISKTEIEASRDEVQLLFADAETKLLPAPSKDAPEQVVVEREIKERVQAALAHLTSHEREIIGMRFGMEENEKPRTLKQIALKFGVSPETIRQIERKALKHLRLWGLVNPNWADWLAEGR